MKFYYKARTQGGEIQSGNVEASSRTAALEVLQRHNLVVIALKEQGGGDFLAKEIFLAGAVRPKEVVLFSRSLASLFDAGVPLVESIRILADQSVNTHFQKVLLEIASDVDGGLSFSRTLGQHPSVFSQFYVNMVKTGEVSGNLQKTLTYLAEYLEKDYNLRAKIRSALTYPAFIVGVFLAVGIIMLLFVIPRLGTALKQMVPDPSRLPAITKIVFALSDFVLQWWWIFIFGLIILIVGAIIYARLPEGRRLWHEWQLKLPIFGALLQKIYQARFAENLSTLIRGGLPIIQSLKITAEVVGNVRYTEIINEVAEQVKTGTTIESVLARYPDYFSAMVTQMVSVGEKSGKLEEILRKTSGFYQGEVDRTVDNLTSLIEPIMIIILGAGVGLVIAAIIIPMYSIVTSLAG